MTSDRTAPTLSTGRGCEQFRDFHACSLNVCLNQLRLGEHEDRFRRGVPPMVCSRPSPSAGEKLKELRLRLGLSTRKVEAKSQQIADKQCNREFRVAHAWVTDVEHDRFNPSIFKLYSLSIIYNVTYAELLSYFGIQMGGPASRYKAAMTTRGT